MASTKSRSSAPVLSLALHRHSPFINFDFARSMLPKRNLQTSSPVHAVQPKAEQRAAVPSTPARKMCLCSPTNHPGAFCCNLHRNCAASTPSNSQVHMRRSAMKNSLVKIGSVEGEEWTKRALAVLIRPSSHQVGRRRSFHPQPSRLRRMTTAEDTTVS